MTGALFVLKSPPYGTLRATEGYRAAVGTASMGSPTSVVLVGDGVYAAVRGQDSSGIDQVSAESLVAALDAAGASVFLHRASVEERGLEPQRLHAFRLVASSELEQLIRTSRSVMVF